MPEKIECRACHGPLDSDGRFAFCSKPECQLVATGFKMAMEDIGKDPIIRGAYLRAIRNAVQAADSRQGGEANA